MKPLIHIGYPKTATTWLQKCFFPYVCNAVYIDKHETDDFIIGNLYNNDIITVFEKKQHLILSSENIIGAINNGWDLGNNYKSNISNIQAKLIEPKLLILIRNQVELITSGYIQYIKNGNNLSLEKYLYGNNGLFDFNHLKFNQVIDDFKLAFGDENIHVFLYEDFISDKTNFLQNIKNVFNLEVDLESIDMREVNSRIKINFIPLKKFANSLSKKKSTKNHQKLFYIPLLSRLINYYISISNNTLFDGGVADSKRVLGDKNISYIEKYYKSSNENLCKIMDSEKLKKYKYIK